MARASARGDEPTVRQTRRTDFGEDALVARLERYLAEAGRDIEALDALDARRLQRDLVVAAAERPVGAGAGAGRGGGACPHIGAGERALLHIARREPQPDHVGALGEAD